MNEVTATFSPFILSHTENMVLTTALLILSGLLWLSTHYIPKVFRSIRFFKEVVGFTFWILVFRELALLIIIKGWQVLVNQWWPADVRFVLNYLNSPHALFYLLGAILVFSLVAVNYRKIMNVKLGPFLAIAFLIVLCNVFTSNALQGGIVSGFSDPISGGEGQSEYYHDAITFKSISEIVSNYNQLQASLHTHSASHPFGPVLVLFFLDNMLSGNVFYIGVILSILACTMIFPSYLLFRQLRLPTKACRTLLIIFAFIPSVVIYFGVSIDAIIALLFTTAAATFIYALNHNDYKVALVSGLVTSMGLLMTYIGLFIIGVVFIWFFIYNTIIIRRRPFSHFNVLIIVLLIPATVLFVIKHFWGFDYLEGFLLACRLENSFPLISRPFDYLVSRLTVSWDLLLFFGPVCSVMLYRALKSAPFTSPSNIFALVGISILAIGFLTGAFRFGDGARICLFILPYLLLPIASQLGNSDTDSLWTMGWLFVESLAMQAIFLFYY